MPPDQARKIDVGNGRDLKAWSVLLLELHNSRIVLCIPAQRNDPGHVWICGPGIDLGNGLLAMATRWAEQLHQIGTAGQIDIRSNRGTSANWKPTSRSDSVIRSRSGT